MAMRSLPFKLVIIFFLSIIILIILSGCISQNNLDTVNSLGADIKFNVTADAKRCQVTSVSLAVFDPTQNLDIPVQTIPLFVNAVDNAFQTTLRLPIGSNLYYSYIVNNQLPEKSLSRGWLTFRAYSVKTHAEIFDSISVWEGCKPVENSGLLEGYITSNGNPVQGMWVNIAGLWSVSRWDGYFSISDIPAGTHTITLFHPEGKFSSQNSLAEIEAGKTTGATFAITPSKQVQITWIVSLPENISTKETIRFVSNHPNYGGLNFSDQWRGITRASSLPILLKHDEHTLYFSGKFYEGMDLRYAYSLGDGLINHETKAGEIFTRNLIIPAEDTIFHDKIESFSSNHFSAKTISVSVPANTPDHDIVSIQFNQNGWLQPIPMKNIGDYRWQFRLTAGFLASDPIQYRFCRNDLCDLTMESDNNQTKPIIYPLDLSNSSDVDHTISLWQFISPDKTTLRVVFRQEIMPRSDNDFLSGMEWNSCSLHSASSHTIEQGIQVFHNSGSNMLVIRPFIPSSANPTSKLPYSFITGQYTIEKENNNHNSQINTQIAVFPTPPREEAILEPSTYSDWFTDYQNAMIDYANLPEMDSVDIFILGGEWITRYLPPDPRNNYQSIASGNADSDWINLIKEVRSNFKGKVFFALPADIEFSAPPLFLDEVDGIYYILNPAIYADKDLKNTLINTIDGPIFENTRIYNKPAIIGFQAPSVSQKVFEKVAENTISCSITGKTWMEWLGKYPVDLQIQMNTYQLVLETINERNWIGGFVSQGNYPGLNQYDYSSSVLGKPAFELLSYWNKNIFDSN